MKTLSPKRKNLVKSFEDLANPHKPKSTPKRRRAPTKNPNPTKLRKTKTKRCSVVPLLPFLFPELLEHRENLNPLTLDSTYRKIVLEAGKLRKELLNLL